MEENKKRVRNILITGGTRGIGASITESFLQKGDRVFAFYNQNHIRAKKFADQQQNENLYIHSVNIRDQSRINELVDRILKNHGQIDVLINNAGLTRDKMINRMEESDWQEVFETNLEGTINCTQTLLPHFIAVQQGTIINLLSLSGFIGNIGQANYCFTKSALTGYTRQISEKYRHHGIRCNAVVPGLINTEMVQHIPDKIKERIIEKTVLKRIGTPQDIARGVQFLSSEKINNINGEILFIDGGLSLNNF